MASKKGTRVATESLGFLAIAAGILVLLNVLGVFAFTRLDLTEKRLFSLSDGSKRVAHGLTDTLEITAYFTEDLPPPHNATERYVRDLLTEYEVASGGKIVVRYVNPDSDEEKEQAEEDGVPEVRNRVFEDDEVTERLGFRGLVMRYLNQKEVIPVVQNTAGLEYELTMRLKKMVGDKRPIGILANSEGVNLTKGLTRLRGWLPTYDLREVNADSEIDDELAALLIVEPAAALSDTQLRRVNQYVMNGGSLGIFGGSMKIGLEGAEPTATAVDSGLNQLLRSWGVEIQEDVVADARCELAPLRTRFGVMAVRYPAVPSVMFDPELSKEHPAIFRLDAAPVPFASSLKLTNRLRDDREVESTTLARSSEDTWLLSGENIPLRIRPLQEWGNDLRAAESSEGSALVVAIEGKLPSAFGGSSESSAEGSEPSNVTAPSRAATKVRVLVSGSASFLRDEFLPEAGGDEQQGGMNNALAFALNAVDWLAQESDLIAIRAKNVEDPEVDVPANVLQATDEATEAQETAEQADAEAAQSAVQGDRESAAKKAAERDDAIERRDAAIEERKAALEQWDTTKGLYRWGNMLGIPLAFALFGVIRWQMRKSKKQNLKL